MADVKVEDIVAENAIGSGFDLSSDGKNACEQLHIAIQSE